MTTPASINAKLDDRYGRSRNGARLAPWIGGGIVAAVILGYLLWMVPQQTTGTVDYDDLGFRVTSAEQVSVTFRVTSSRNAPVVCTLEALDEEFGVVGWKVVELPANDRVHTDYTETIPTVAEATTGFVNTCALR
ncbi:DUF4307 domain-containing protein [Microbacterium amylolyticum]|uniref:DUF4307 domain-containing protein n=1 Tax=Microbacterium amylolyticum TaxID=936337 RepID=A0ABS4ZF93_9MICO|nr:DUF4307 domain-containing protein [Microbacterium amylolyticum]MBP2435957.1 hypothetical protein [Microbacterium amylolyticum]